MSYLIIINNTLLCSFKTPQPGYYLRISKGGCESSLVSYQLLLILPLKKDIPVVFSAGKSGLVKPGVFFPESPFSVSLARWSLAWCSYKSSVNTSRYKAEFRNSSSSARFRSLCRAEKQRQWFNRPVLSEPFHWGLHTSARCTTNATTFKRLDTTNYQFGASAGGSARPWVLREMLQETSCRRHYFRMYFLGGSLWRLHWVVSM